MERRVFVILRGARSIAKKIAARAVCLLCTAHPPMWNGSEYSRRETKSFSDLPCHRCLRRPSILSLAITPSGSKLPFLSKVRRSCYTAHRTRRYAPTPPRILSDRNIMTASYFFSHPRRQLTDKKN